MSKIHELKIEERYLEQLISGEKTFELRWNDRNYQKGDTLEFEDFDEESCVTPIMVSFKILSVFSCGDQYGLLSGWVILSLKKL